MNKAIRNFAGGEIAPALYGKNDLVKYQTGAKQLRNMTIMRSGGVQNRAGFQFIGEVGDSTKDVRLQQFDYTTGYLVLFEDDLARLFYGGAAVTKNWSKVTSATQAATCVVQVTNAGNATDGAQTAAILQNTRITFSGITGMTQLNGNTYKAKNIVAVSTQITQFDLYSTSDVAVDSTAFGVFSANDDGIATTAVAITGATKANPCVLTIVGNGLQVGDLFDVSGVLGMTELNGRTFKVASRTEDTVTLDEIDGTNVNSTNYTTYVSGGTVARHLILPSPYQEADLRYLNFTQAGVEMVIAHADYKARTLTRYAASDFGFGIHQLTPEFTSPTNTTPAGAASHYVITAVDPITFEESLISADVEAAGSTVTWTHPGGPTPAYYNIYKGDTGFYGWIGSAGSSPFSDSPAIDPDYSIGPPFQRDILATSGNYPGVVTDFQQRRIFARSHAANDTAWASRTALPTNFTISEPITEDAAVTLRLLAKRRQEIRHMLDVGGLIGLTNRGPWIIAGDQADILRPDSVNPRQFGENGCDYAAPVVVGGAIVYIHADRSLIMAFGTEVSGDGYKGSDLTVFSSHLFDGYGVNELAWQSTPNSIVWAVRSDGKLLALSYMKEQEIWGWTICDTDGEVENVCAVQEGNVDRLYAVVAREINGSTKKYVERMTRREFSAAGTSSAIFLDSHLTYDGRNTAATTMTLTDGTTIAITAATQANPIVLTSAGHGLENGDTISISGVVGMTQLNSAHFKVVSATTNTFSLTTEAGVAIDSSAYTAYGSGGAISRWDDGETLTCTASVATFASTDVGNAVHIDDADGEELRFTITGFTSTTVVTGTAHKVVPLSLRATATDDWSLAVDTVNNLWHLEGCDVAVFADSYVVGNPLTDEAADLITVENGSITLDRPYAVIHVGLPYIADVETLDLDSSGSQSISDKKILVSKVSMRLDKSRGIYVGPQPPSDDDTDPLENLTPAKARTRGDAWGPIALSTREVDVMIDGKFSRGGRVFVRQVDPLPMSILSITPHFTVDRER